MTLRTIADSLMLGDSLRRASATSMMTLLGDIRTIAFNCTACIVHRATVLATCGIRRPELAYENFSS
jgi:hypothetical protein